MTGTVDIQELKGRARWLKDYGVKTMICDPDAILVLIEENEKLREAAEYYSDVFCELGPSHEACGKLDRDQCSGCIAKQSMEGLSK